MNYWCIAIEYPCIAIDVSWVAGTHLSTTPNMKITVSPYRKSNTK